MWKSFIKFILLLFVAQASYAARDGFQGYQQDWGHVTVREGAHMFWWLHYTLADVPAYTDRPLVLWLQGGPGSSSTGYGNFEILGPFDLDLNERSFTWINEMNVLFVDNPVGTGYSYVDHIKFLTRDNQQIARDLVELLRGFYAAQPEFESVPLHIYGESYGGKMAIEFAHELYWEIANGGITSNLITVAMGDSWISPIDSTLSWAPYLLQLGFIDVDGHDKINTIALRTQKALDKGEFFQATDLWYQTETVLLMQAHGVDFYNVLYNTSYRSSEAEAKLLVNPRQTAYNTMVTRKRFYAADDEESTDPLTNMMRGPVHAALDLPSNVVWGSQSGAVFDTLAGDFMKPVVEMVEKVLNTTSVQVVVYSGQLDLICSTPGTVEWINRMQWYGSKQYAAATRNGIGIDGILEGYVRRYGNFSMFWLNRAGHMAPFDNPRAMGYVLRQTTNYG